MSPKKVLVASNEMNILRLIEINLRSRDFIVATAVNCKEALEMARNEKPQLMILDTAIM